MLKKQCYFIVVIFLLSIVMSLSGARGADSPDWRNIEQGLIIPDLSYSDQPYIVKTDDGAWLCCLTTGTGHEGQSGQIVITQRSLDQVNPYSAISAEITSKEKITGTPSSISSDAVTVKLTEPVSPASITPKSVEATSTEIISSSTLRRVDNSVDSEPVWLLHEMAATTTPNRISNFICFIFGIIFMVYF